MTEATPFHFARHRGVAIRSGRATAWLVGSADASPALASKTHERVPPMEADWILRHVDLQRVRDLLSRTGVPLAARRDGPSDVELITLLHEKIAGGHLALIREAHGGAATERDEDAALVRTVSSALTGNLLVVGGGRYRLITGTALNRLRDRAYFHVVRKAEAILVLARAAELPAFARVAEALRTARARLAEDWRPPHQPQGLVLLRHQPVVQRSGSDRGESLTPSALRKLRDESWIEIQFVDAGMEPVPNVAFEITLSEGTTKSGTTGSDGTARFEGIQPGECRVRFPKAKGPVVLV